MSNDAECSSAASATRNLRFTIPSDFERSHEVQQQIMAEVGNLGYCDAALFAIKLSLDEALVNAIKHGNHLDKSKTVHIEADIGPEQARFVVEDQGQGFDRDGVADPRCDGNLEKCCGRGILLIEAYMTRVAWSDKGRRCTMVRVNAPDSPSASSMKC